MGTNFYAKHIPSEQEYAKMQEALTNRQLDKLRELIDIAQTEYHIGKRSSGWQFMFCPHIKNKKDCYWGYGQIISPWEDTLESIKEYLSRDDVQIIDEYGNEFTVEQFFNDEIGYCLYHDKDNAINGEDHDNPKNYPISRLPISTYEYTTEEGLRFATTEDWS